MDRTLDSLEAEGRPSTHSTDFLDATLEPEATRETDLEPEPVGLAYLETTFATNPEALAVNTATAMIVALDQTENAIRNGPENDVTLVGTKSQDLLVTIFTALTETERRRAGYSSLFEGLKASSGYPEEGFRRYLGDFTDSLRLHLDRYPDWTITERYAEAQNMRPSIQFLQFAAERFLDQFVEHAASRAQSPELESMDDELLCDLDIIGKILLSQQNPRMHGLGEVSLAHLAGVVRKKERAVTL